MARVAALALILALVLAPGYAVKVAHASAEPDDVLVYLLDLSGSMGAAVEGGGGDLRLDQAKEALGSALSLLDEAKPVGLRTFSGSCDERGTELLIPPRAGSREDVADRVPDLIADGTTPLSIGLEAALDDVTAAGGGEIVLISDGQEQCGDRAAACDLATSLGSDVPVVVNTIGFGEAADTEVLTCIAEQTGGTYSTVDDEQSLEDALIDEDPDEPDEAGSDWVLGLAFMGLAAVPVVYLVRPSSKWRQRRMVRTGVRVVPGGADADTAPGEDAGESGSMSIRVRPGASDWTTSTSEGEER